MKLALFSDLHTEFLRGSDLKSFLDPMLHADADVCVLAGDIASGRDNVKKVLKIFADAYNYVVYVSGNHEYYGSDIDTFDSITFKENNIYFLNPGSINIGDITFIGGSLWTNFGNDEVAAITAKSRITDFRRIKDFTPLKAKEIYNKHLAYIKRMYSIIPGEKVIVTHFLPAQACISPRFNDGNLLNKYFANYLDNWISDLKNTTWMFGHTHDTVDVTLGNTRLVCNPYGYFNYETNTGFDHNKTINTIREKKTK
jgi:Icc-related predicted phosphoesterase